MSNSIVPYVQLGRFRVETLHRRLQLLDELLRRIRIRRQFVHYLFDFAQRRIVAIISRSPHVERHQGWYASLHRCYFFRKVLLTIYQIAASLFEFRYRVLQIRCTGLLFVYFRIRFWACFCDTRSYENLYNNFWYSRNRFNWPDSRLRRYGICLAHNLTTFLQRNYWQHSRLSKSCFPS